MGTVEILLLGPVEVRVDGAAVAAGGRRQRIVLALLAARAGQVVSIDELADAVWGDDAVDRSRGTLQVYMSNLRRVLGPAGATAIAARAPGYLLDGDAVALDVPVFVASVDGARAAAAQGDHHRAVTLLRAALGSWRGDFVADLADVDAFAGDRARLGEQRLDAMEALFDSELELGRQVAVIPELTAALERHPLREHLWGQLMLALYRAGRQAEALRAYQDARAVLVEELGVEPGPHLRRLEGSILAQSESIRTPVADAPSLLWLAADGTSRRVELVAGGSIEVGRSPGCDVAIEWDPRVSRRHAVITHGADGWTVTDAGSQNGTFVNGERVAAAVLADGDVLRFGDAVALVRLEGSATSTGRQPVVGETLTTDQL